MTAARLHELRVEARRLLDAGRSHEGVQMFLVAADLADELAMRVEAEQLRTNARRGVILIWARTRWPYVWFDHVVPVHAPSDALRLKPTRRFKIATPVVCEPSGETRSGLEVFIDANDRIRMAPLRKDRHGR